MGRLAGNCVHTPGPRDAAPVGGQHVCACETYTRDGERFVLFATAHQVEPLAKAKAPEDRNTQSRIASVPLRKVFKYFSIHNIHA